MIDIKTASFLQRFLAVVLDAFILAIPQYLLTSILSDGQANRFGYTDPEMLAINNALWSLVVGIGTGWLYFALMESSSRQGTLGKIALRIKVVDLSGGNIDFARASGRHFGKMLSAVPFGVGYFMQLFSRRGQTLHDMLAGCLVVNR